MNSKINHIEKLIGSGIYTGYLPFAQGTFASLAAVIIYLIPGFENSALMTFCISVFYVAGTLIAGKFIEIYGADPRQCTIDEFVGTWISLLFIPKKIWFIVPAFLIWRVFDIIKPFPANAAEKIKGGTGVMLDDVIAGIYTFLLMQIMLYFIY
ncbi:MAG: phosphatidylglycerophosphatase A [Melioribacteraceae bacterium]|nr:phosphatidylglycerophosphatase A [Melioribacteraceae bacterium]